MILLRDEPMPAGVACLPRTDDGVPVTWAAAWEGELAFDVRPEPLLQPLLGAAPLAYFGGGEPLVGRPHISLPEPGRVRRGVLLGLCQVCGDELPAGPRNLLDLRSGWDTLRVGKRMVPLLIDAWTCDICLPYSLRVCPELQRRPDAEVLTVHEWVLVPTVERPKWIPDDVPYGPIGFIKIAPTRYVVAGTVRSIVELVPENDGKAA